MPTYEKAVDVAAPAPTVYRQCLRFESYPRFMQGVERVDQWDDVHLRWVTSTGGLTRQFDAEITERVPDRRVAWRVTGRAALRGGRVDLVPLDDRTTRVVLHMDYAPEAVTEEAETAVGAVGLRLQGDLDRFKDYVEHGGTSGTRLS